MADFFVLGTDVGRKVHIRCLPVIYQDQIVVAVTVSVYVGLVIVIYHKTVTGIVAAVSACRIQKTADFRCLFIRDEEDTFYVLRKTVDVITDIVGIQGTFPVLQNSSVTADGEKKQADYGEGADTGAEQAVSMPDPFVKLHRQQQHERNQGDQVIAVFHGQIPRTVSGIDEKQNNQVPGQEECEKMLGAYCIFRAKQSAYLADAGSQQQEQEQNSGKIQDSVAGDGGDILNRDGVQSLEESQKDSIEIQLPVFRFGQEEDIASRNDTAYVTGQTACCEGGKSDNAYTEMIPAVFSDFPVIQEIETCIEKQGQKTAEHHIETAGQGSEEEEQGIDYEEQNITFRFSSAGRNGEQLDQEQGQQHFDHILGAVEEHHVKVFQHTVGVRRQHEDNGDEGMPAVRCMAENDIDNTGKTTDHDKIAQPEGKEDIMGECIERHCQKQGAVQFHSRDIFPARNKEGFVMPHFHSVHIQLGSVIIDHLRRFE